MMQKIDVNCLVGEWPFRRSRYGKVSDLQKIHRDNGIGKGFLSSLQSVFYNDPMEAEEELAKCLDGTGYYQVCTVNPTFPAVEEYIDEMVKRFGVKAVRICPGYHGYRLDDACMEPLGRALAKYGLPLYVTVRLEDRRLNYIVSPRDIPTHELRVLADIMPHVKLLYTNIHPDELVQLEDIVNRYENVFAETSCFKGPAFCLDYVLAHIDRRKILYGSSAPLYTLRSTLSEVERKAVPEETRRQILLENAMRFFDLE